MKKNLFFTIGAVIVLACTACANIGGGDDTQSTSDGVINLKFWNGFTGKDGDAMRSIVNDFNLENRGEIKVKADSVLWDNLFLKLIQNKDDTANSPHLVVVPANRVALVRKRGIVRTIEDLPEYCEVTQDDYLEGAWNVGVQGGARYSFPLDMHPTLLYYNKDLISEDELPSTWEEFIAVAKAKTTDRVYGWAIPSMYSVTLDIYMNLLIQNGTDLFELRNGNYTPVFNSQLHIDLLEQLRTWKYVEKISPVSVGAAGDLTLFNSGKSVFYFDGIYQMNAMYETSPIDWGTVQMPNTYGPDGTGYSGSHQWTLVESTTKDAKIKEACYKFINYVNQNAVKWAAGGQVPAAKVVHDKPEFLELEHCVTALNQAKVCTLGTMKYDYYYEAYNFVGSAVANSLGNNTPARTALDNAFAQFQQFLVEDAY